MNKFYIIVLLTVLSLAGKAQQVKADFNAPLESSVIKELRFYPNPAVNEINFEFNKGTQQRELTLQIYNFLGKKVFESNAVSQKTTVSLTNFYRGVYIFQLRDKSGRIVESGKFQVNK